MTPQALVATVQMWGCLACFREGEDAGVPDYLSAITQPCRSPMPLTGHTLTRCLSPELASSAKAFLATEQRVPGLGNGVAQDILWTSHIHPKRKMATLSGVEIEGLFNAVKSVLADMVAQGGRDTSATSSVNLAGIPRSSAATRRASPGPPAARPFARMPTWAAASTTVKAASRSSWPMSRM